jgi:hypothetical protein
MRKLVLVLTLLAGLLGWSGTAVANPPPPQTEPAYYNGSSYTMIIFDIPQNPGVLEHATADLYAVLYPPALLPALAAKGVVPQCDPCTHNGVTSFHDHVIDSIPSTGHGDYSPIWLRHKIVPNYTGPTHDAAVNAAYLADLPLKSEAAVLAFVAAGFAREVDVGTYFICAVVSPNVAQGIPSASTP